MLHFQQNFGTATFTREELVNCRTLIHFFEDRKKWSLPILWFEKSSTMLERWTINLCVFLPKTVYFSTFVVLC
jgi:hypothetical protein